MIAGKPFWCWGIPTILRITASEKHQLHLTSPVVQHYKGGLYAHIIPSIPVKSRHDRTSSENETLERMVVYKSLSEPNRWWCRPYDIFHSPNRFVAVSDQFHDHVIPTDRIVVYDAEREDRRFLLTIYEPLHEPSLIQIYPGLSLNE